LLVGCILTALGLQLSALLGVSSPLLLDGDEQLSTTPSSPACVSTARKFSVLRLEDSRINQYIVEVQDWMVLGLRGHGVDVNTPMWPSCLGQPPNHPASCVGRLCVSTFACSSDAKLLEDTMSAMQDGHNTSMVIFNLEVIMDAQLKLCFADPRFEPIWRQAVVWDYSSENLASLARLGLSPPAGHPYPARPAVINLTYYPGISGDPADDYSPPRLERFHEPYDYDVLLLMGITERRMVILNALQQRNLTVYCPNNVGPGAWGADRTALVRRSAVQLNVHQFDVALMESPRLFFLLSLGAAVLSEETTDPVARAYWADGVEFAPYDQLADAAVRLVANATRRYELAMAGYKLVRRVSPRDSIRDPLVAALDWTNTPYSLQECPTHCEK
jgi:hypothetical protein